MAFIFVFTYYVSISFFECVTSSLWFQPIWSTLYSQIRSFLQVGVKIKKMKLPPPSFSIRSIIVWVIECFTALPLFDFTHTVTISKHCLYFYWFCNFSCKDRCYGYDTKLGSLIFSAEHATRDSSWESRLALEEKILNIRLMEEILHQLIW